MEEEERFPPLSSSFVLKDISNFKTPKRIPKNPQFFTACNETPRSSSSFSYRSRPSLVPSSSRSKAKAKLKAFQLERSQSACKEQLKKDRSLKSLAKSLTAWLNLLFQNPEFCGCDLSINGCNESNVVRVDSAWRSPKRMRELWWRGEESENVVADVSSLKYSSLRSSLKEVCSFDELKQRMQVYLSLASCKEVFDVMTQVAKNIDGGRLKMKANCSIVTDIGIKEKATKILMSYNPIWLRIGLYIIFGGDSLISPEGDFSSVKDISFLKMIIEKQFFSHTGLAKAYAYNKKVEGLYRPGYYENLGNIILKRTLLLVLILDRAKSQTSLPLNYGIDGVDGGSPLLFTVSSGIKSSRQVLNNFLSSDVMHGEGDLLAHLVIVGYKVSHQQSALVEFDFQVSDLFLDLQDGVRLCRVIQLLRHDSSILMKIVVPSDTHKKNLANCGVALQYLREAGVMLCDEDGLKITRDDVADRDTELTLSLLWNIFVRLQLTLLIDRTSIASEISKIRGFNMDKLNVINSTNLGMLLNWIQAICENYGLKVDSFSSLVNRKAIWCLLDYYFRRELSCSNKVDSHETRDEKSIMSTTDYTDAVHNFVLSQKLTAILGKFPEVLQISDLLEHNGAVSDKSVVVLLTFLLSQLIVKKNVDQLNFHKLLDCNCQTLERRRHSLTRRRSASSEAIVLKDRDLDITEGPSLFCDNPHFNAAKKFKIIQAWWRDMTERNYKNVVRPVASTSSCFPAQKTSIDILREKAAIVIQSHFRRFIERHNFLKMTKAIGLIQAVTRAWLTVKKNSELNKFSFAGVPEVPSGVYSYLKLGRLVKFIGERHSFVNLRRSVLLIQHVARILVAQRRDASCPILIKAAIVIQKCFRGWVVRSLHMIENASRKCQQKGLSNSEIEAATGIQIAWKNFVSRSLHKHTFAATKIQSHFRGWQLKRSFMKQKQAIITIQSNFRQFKCSSTFQQYKTARIENVLFKYEEKSLSISETEAASRIQIAWKNFVCRYLHKQTYAATKIQSHYRAWHLRRSFIKQKQEIIKIQSNFRRLKCWRAFQIAQKEFVCRSLQNQTFAATKIQSHFRGWQLRRSFVKQKQAIIAIQSKLRQLKCSSAFQQYKMAARSAIIIQSCVRRWIAQRRALRCRYLTVAIQRHCRGWLARKDLLKQRDAVIKIQRAIRCVICQKAFHLQKLAAIEIQRAIRGQISRNKLLGASSFCAASASSYGCNMSKGFFQSFELKLVIISVLKLQRWWRSVLLFKLRTKSAIIIQSHSRGWIAKQKAYIERHCIVLIQRHCRGWLVRKEFSMKRDSVIKIQRAIRCLICQKAFHLQKLAAIDIQRVIRGQLFRSRLLGASSFHAATAGSYNCKMSKGFFQSFELKLVITSVLKLQRWWRGVMLLKLRTKSAIIIQSHARGWIAKRETYRQKHCIVVIQRQSRGWLVRKDVLLRRDAVIKIQRAIRSLICQKAFHLQKLAAIDIQNVIRGQIARSRLLGANSVQAASGGACNCNMSGGFVRSFELTLVIISVLKLQRWWRGVLLLKSRARSVIIIQTHARGWIARQKAYRKRTCIVVIQNAIAWASAISYRASQILVAHGSPSHALDEILPLCELISYWKGYVARKESREQLLNLRLRMQKSAMNVDDSRRLINRLLSALSELLSMKSIRGILHNCETLDMATAHSLKCCEELVAAGAITILLKLIRAASRSIPDQQVLKHALSTLRNLARYPHLTQVLIDTPASVETILWELHRNKEEGYFIASQILKKICSNENGVITVHKFPALLKRLYNLVEELTRKAYNEKRNPRAVAVRDNTDRRRLKEAVELLKLITNGYKSSKLPIAFAM
ncbi:abnormal spindle-like microcephaly-associated protein-like protein isoform X1 [Gossypium australe]|uniref:Abnormal spindle-like microcephaly-associated protein-like protein isoform X1 n=1 Tax=Gossypium australe TaxID=47621 RepID=A0A5B6WCC3_9ROSI|nr:abnormal spindle-like microcephaly-associated protein-like protein isoform X1 [Gossypium australe]KAA3478799.1 abnormal spindle-like microcephaly-associated protein-like protein isoform X1 [Gossypium australe]